MSRTPATAHFFVGVDIGGTFTDVILAEQDSPRLLTAKTLTTHDNPSEGVIAALGDVMAQASIRPGSIARVVHATTLATNLILEGKGARVGFVTTRGFGDLLQLGWGSRSGPERYDLLKDHLPRPVERVMTVEASERLDHLGQVVEPLDVGRLAGDVRKLVARGAESFAVCFLHSYANPEHERQAAEAIQRENPRAYVAVSSEVWPEFREYERATTTVMSAAVGPVVASYLRGLEDALTDMGVRAPLQIMQSSGGVMSASAVAKRPIQSVESGPAAGVIGAAAAGALYGCKDIICFDMGGTTAKAGLVRDGKPSVVHGFRLGGGTSAAGSHRAGAGFPIKIPTIDLAEVGAGGGSIAWVDAGGVLQVGPRSAGSMPGPACYGGGGTEPTVTDADLVLGYFNADYFLGGKMPVFPERAHEAIESRIAKPLGMDVIAAASGIHEIVNAKMAAAVRLVTVERGIDPRDFSVIAFGGAGPSHIVDVVEEFGVKSVIVPTTPGLASAAGLLMTDMTADYVRTRVMDQDALDTDGINAIFAELEQEGRARMLGEGLPEGNIQAERLIDARFRGQGHELSVPVSGGLLTDDDLVRTQHAFRAMYADLYGVRLSDAVQFVHFRSRTIGLVPKLELARSAPVSGDGQHALKNTRPVFFRRSEGFVETAVYDRARLVAGDALRGPAVVEEPDSTTIVPPGYVLTVGDYRQLVITRADL